MNKAHLSNDSGYTLVELIVAIAIMGFVMLAISGFLITGSNMGDRGKKQIGLSEDSRITIAKMKEDLLDTDEMVINVSESATGDQTFYLCSENEAYSLSNPIYDVKVYKYDSTAGQILYNRGNGLALTSLTSLTPSHILCENVSDFKLEVTTTKESGPKYTKTDDTTREETVVRVEIPKADSAKINLNLAKGGFTFNADDVVAFRSQTMSFSSIDEAQKKVDELIKADAA